MASVVLVVALLGLFGAITSSAMLGESSTETTIATQGAQQALERLHGETLEDVYATFTLNPNFPVAGLDVRAGDLDGMVGAIEFPVTVGPPPALREDLDDPDFGMPLDLNGDGVIDAADHADDYIVLPVRVRVAWTGLSGERAIELETILRAR